MSMMLTKIKTVMAALLVLGAFTLGGGSLIRHTVAQEVEPGKPPVGGEDAGRAQALEKAPAPRKISDKQKPERASSTSPITPSYVIMPPDILLVEVDGLPKESPLKEVQCLVRPDGTISLGAYGPVHVAELTLAKISVAIAAKLAEKIGTDAKLDVRVNVISYNSKVYYVIATGKDNETVFRFACTGGDTVVSAVFQAGLVVSAIKGRVFVRAWPSCNILEVDWRAITQEGKTETNYLLQPCDRVYVEYPLSKDTSRVPPVEGRP
jgi:protein involved in polysaccharide export with SLBB domain